MDLKKERRKIYLRCFALLLVLWMALMAAFSWRLRRDARTESFFRFVSFARSAQQDFSASWEASGYALEESSWRRIAGQWEPACFTASLFTYEGEPVWSPGDPAIWTVLLGSGQETAAWMEPARWFDLEEVSREISALSFPHDAKLVLEDVLLTEDGEAVPRTMLLKYCNDTIAAYTNTSFDQYEGTPCAQSWIRFPVDAQTALDAIECQEDIRKIQDIAANSSSLMEMQRDRRAWGRGTVYTIDPEITYQRSWDGLDCAFVSVVGFGPIVQDTWREAPDSLPVSYSHPAYWLVLAGRSDVWGSEGAYWLCSLLISLAGFLAAAWVLAHTAWKGQKAHLLYQRRTRETANAIAHNLKTPMSVLHASAENLQANICPEKQGAYLEEIVRQTEAMDQVLLDILELAGPSPKPSGPQ